MDRIGLRIAAMTDPGRAREHNEDGILISDLEHGARASAREIERKAIAQSWSVGERGVLLAVSDGMGGAAAGEVASSLSLQALHDELVHDDRGGAVSERLARVVRRASRRVREAGHGRRRGMGATLTAALVCGGAAHLAQIGDSRAYLIRNGELRQVTRDQSYVQMLVDEGMMTPEEAERSPQRNVIMQVMGQHAELDVALGRIPVAPGDVLMLCSDGLTNAITDAEILRVLQATGNVSEACERLVVSANRAGGPDNVTVLLAAVAADEVNDS